MSTAPRTVFKFGGAALADGPGVQRVVSVVAEHLAANPVVVVSAHSGVTNLLRELAELAPLGRADVAQVRIRHRSLCAQLGLESELLNRFWIELSHLLSGIARRGMLTPRDRDAVLSIGERVSARIVARTLRSRGVFATPVDAFDLGFVAEHGEGEVTPRADSSATVRAALAEVPGLPVVTGFLARTESGLVTTLGPNGSDWTASWLAEAIGAHELVFWKSVSGFMTADPNLVSTARVIEKLSWQDAAELTRQGAGVLHPRSIEPARRAGVRVTIRDVGEAAAPGTLLIEGDSGCEAVGLATSRKSETAMRIAIVGGQQAVERGAACLNRFLIDFESDDLEPACLVVSDLDLMRAMEALHEELFEQGSRVHAIDRED